MRRRQLVDGRIEQKKVGVDAGHIGPDLLLTLGEDLEEVSEDLRQRVRLLLVGQSKVEAAWGRVDRQGPPERLLACRSPPAPQRLVRGRVGVRVTAWLGLALGLGLG